MSKKSPPTSVPLPEHGHSNTNLEAVQRLFDKPIREAALILGMSVSKLKILCRDWGVKRWPYRKVASLRARIKELVLKIDRGTSGSPTDSSLMKQMNVELEELRNELREISPALLIETGSSASEEGAKNAGVKRRHGSAFQPTSPVDDVEEHDETCQPSHKKPKLSPIRSNVKYVQERPVGIVPQSSLPPITALASSSMRSGYPPHHGHHHHAHSHPHAPPPPFYDYGVHHHHAGALPPYPYYPQPSYDNSAVPPPPPHPLAPRSAHEKHSMYRAAYASPNPVPGHQGYPGSTASSPYPGYPPMGGGHGSYYPPPPSHMYQRMYPHEMSAPTPAMHSYSSHSSSPPPKVLPTGEHLNASHCVPPPTLTPLNIESSGMSVSTEESATKT